MAFHRCLLIGLLGLCAAQLPAHSNPGIRVHMHGVEGYAADGLLYTPEGTRQAGALILVPDERGVTRRITDAANGFREAGFAVVVVDLNRGMSPETATRSTEQADHDLNAALVFISAQANTGPAAVGLLGWGSGGAAALRLAADKDLRAVAIEDAAPAGAYAHLKATQAAVLAAVPAHPAAPGLLSPKDLDAKLRAISRAVSVKTQDDGGFDDPEDAKHFNAAEASSIRKRQLEFYERELGSRSH